jgi:DNA-directed RNA polymerase subunit beta'
LAYLAPTDAFDDLKSHVLEGIRSHFPNGSIQGKLQSLHLENLEVQDDLHPDDIRGQHAAKVNGESWAVPVFATFALKDKAGQLIDRQRIRVAEIPKTTRRHSYLVDGREYQVSNQWQLKPGVYARRRQNGELESQFNVKDGRRFDLAFDPDTKIFTMDYNKAHPPLYPLLKTLGATDEELEKAWGKEILTANKNARNVGAALEAFYRTSKGTAPSSHEEAAAHFYQAMERSKLRPDSTSVTLGKPLTHVTSEAIRLATEKMLKVQAGHPEDDRDSLVFKDLRSAGDFAYDKLRGAGPGIRKRIERKINTAKEVRDIIKMDLFDRPVRDTFKENEASSTPSQINPLEMLGSAMQTTIMGPGGIRSERGIVDEAKFVNPSHLGFLDPINTPEGAKTGVTLRLPVGLKKVGNEARIQLYNTRTHEMEHVNAATFLDANVVLPDQVRWENGRPKPISDTVKMSVKNNAIENGKFEDAHYVMRLPAQLFNITANLIPFMGNTSGGRASMASRQMEQAISLVHREPPLVQVSTGVPGPVTFEQVVGDFASHVAPVDGHVTSVKKDAIVITDKSGQKHEVQLYQHYPLNDAKGMLHSTPTVKVGDEVKEGKSVADTNFSKNGTLALGTNLRVAFIPFRGYNFEDGIVISQSAADKLSSEHLHKHTLAVDGETKLNKAAFMREHHNVFKKDQLAKLDDDGIVRVGSRVSPGDPLVAAMKPFRLKDRTGLSAIRRSMSGAHTDKSLRWDADASGEVVSVHRGPDGVSVHVKTTEPMQVGDKLTGRAGNKGIVTRILPDAEMPHTPNGEHIEVALNPSGVPGRMNVSQVLETAAGKVAKKTGKTYLVENFEPGVDFLARVKSDLKTHGLSDTEELIDPVTKQSLGHALVGPMHMLKLVHQVDKKLSVRSGMDPLPGSGEHETYDSNLQPASGGHTGGQAMGTLGLYALLAHGAKANIREMQSYKSEGPDPNTSPSKQWPSDHRRIWAAIATGGALPTPKPTFAFQKFEDLLRGAGVNLEKKGHDFILTPLTDDQIRTLAPKELPKPAELVHRNKVDGNGDPKPITGGLFDEKLTGGHGGRQWTRISLAEPLPNPVFEAPIRHLTGLSQKDYDAVIAGTRGITPNGHLTDTHAGITGGAGIKLLLERIDVKKDLRKAEEELRTVRGEHKVDSVLKRVKYLRALDTANLKPADAYVLHNLPVMPPVLRAVSRLPDGNLQFEGLTKLYSDFAKVNDKLKDPVIAQNLDDAHKQELRESLYDGVKALMGVGIPYEGQKLKGILHQISGSQPKRGYFQRVLINRRQDLTMRSTIVPEPALGLDEVGLPSHAALSLYRPFVIRKLREMGAIQTELQAPALLAKPTPSVWRALDRVMEERPVLLKRDPALHKYSVQGFRARRVEGSAVQIHPLVTGGFTADFDGDSMSAYVPITREAVAEAHKMFPSNNLFSEATGRVMYQPTLESALGLYKLGLVGKETGKTFKNPAQVVEAVQKGHLLSTDVVELDGKKTTPGRVMLAAALPKEMQDTYLHDFNTKVDGKGLDAMLTTLAKNHHELYGDVVNKLKDIGNGAASGSVRLPLPTAAGHAFAFQKFENTHVAVHDPSKNIFVPTGVHTLSLKDFTPDYETRDKVLKAAHAEAASIYASTKIPQADKDRQAINVYKTAGNTMKTLHEEKMKKDPSNLFTMYSAGVKPGWEQYKQMVLAPMIYQDSADQDIPTPVTKSYSEGLDLGSYWTQMHGARRGAVLKVQGVEKPGVMSKLLMQNMMNVLITKHDCGTNKGVALSVQERDIHDRYLQKDFDQDGLHVPAGTLLTPDIVGKIRSVKKDARLVVRSPLKCEEEQGICQKCSGVSSSGDLHPLGTNIGVLSAHTVGERAVQLTLKAFHTGGVREASGSKVVNAFKHFSNLLMLPEHVPNEATLSMVSGKVEKIQPTATGVDIFVGGKRHHVSNDARGMPLHAALPNSRGISGYMPWQPPVVGMQVEAGQHLSDPNRTVVNPRQLFKATNSMERVQGHLVDEIHGLYAKEGIKRRAIETIVRVMGNLTEVTDSGDHPTVLRGEYRPTTTVYKLNAELIAASKKPIEHKPTLKGIEVLPLEMQEDWMAKLQHRHLRETLMEAAATRGVSHIHGTHPVPGMAFGSELGLTKRDASKPGYGHLKDVPEHFY